MKHLVVAALIAVALPGFAHAQSFCSGEQREIVHGCVADASESCFADTDCSPEDLDQATMINQMHLAVVQRCCALSGANKQASCFTRAANAARNAVTANFLSASQRNQLRVLINQSKNEGCEEEDPADEE